MAYNVLSLDGGGIRGIVSVVLMERLSHEPGLEGWLDKVHLLAGTSTGGLLAMGIAAGKTLGELHDLYVNHGGEIFDDPWPDDIKDLGKLAGADYELDNLEALLLRLVGTTTLGELNKRVVVTAFDLDNEDADATKRSWKPKIFHNYPGDPGNDGSAQAYKVGMYTSAAPTYFPSIDGYVDGGVFATNPSMCALAQTQDPRIGENIALGDLRLFSLGTGKTLSYIKGHRHDYGYVQWIKPLVNILLDGVAGVADFQVKQILRDKYHRLAPIFPPGTKIGMDTWQKMDEMLALANAVDISAAADWLRANWA